MGIVNVRFAFIHDVTLRKEIELNYLFIADLETIFWELPEAPENEVKRFWYKKMIIILTASIVEAMLLYTIQTLEVKHKKTIGIQKTRDKEIGVLDTGEKLVTYKEKRVQYNPVETTFADSIQILWDEFWGYFPKEICDKLHEMRRLRNGVHIQLKISGDTEFSKIGIYALFKNAGEVINLCKTVL